MSDCVLCNQGNGIYPLYKNGNQSAQICENCQRTLAQLFYTAENQDYGAYITYRDIFRRNYANSPYADETAAKADSIWEAAHVMPADEIDPAQAVTPPTPQLFPPTEDLNDTEDESDFLPPQPAPGTIPADGSFYPNKLLLSTLIGLVALFMPVLGLLPALIAKNMADEIPYPYCARDVSRARNICIAAIAFSLLEIIAGVITLIVLAVNVF